MGATSSTAQPQPPLVAVDAAGLYSRFTTTRTEELALKVCGDHFFGGSTIKDAKSGEVVFTVRYPFFTWTKKVEILEVGGRLLLTLQEKFFSWRPITYGFDARKPQAASGAATPSLSVIFSSSSNADITFRNWVKSDEKEHQKEVEMQLKIERGFFKPTRATVSNTNGQLAAQMVLGSSAASDTLLSIAPGADAVLMTAICIIIKDREQAKDEHVPAHVVADGATTAIA